MYPFFSFLVVSVECGVQYIVKEKSFIGIYINTVHFVYTCACMYSGSSDYDMVMV